MHFISWSFNVISLSLFQDQGPVILAWLPHKKTIWISVKHAYNIARARGNGKLCACRYTLHACICTLYTTRMPIPVDQIERPADRARSCESVRHLLCMPHPAPGMHCVHSVSRYNAGRHVQGFMPTFPAVSPRIMRSKSLIIIFDLKNTLKKLKFQCSVYALI